MAFNLSALTAYTDQRIEPLLLSCVFDAKTQQLIKTKGNLLTGVKGPTQMPVFDTDAIFQTQSCSFDPSGTTAISQRLLEIGKIKIEEKLCPKDLEVYFTQELLKAGSTYEDFGNAQWQAAYLDRKNMKIAAQLEVALWQGDTGSTNVNLNKFNGLIKLLGAGSPVSANTGAYSGTPAVSNANVLGIVQNIKNKIPACLKGDKDVMIFVGYDFYDAYIDAGIAANYFSYNFQDDSNYGGMKIPGTGIRLEAVHGLDGTGKAYGMRMSNVAMGVDLESESENYKMWYSQDNNDVRFRAEFKLGINVAFTTEVVSFLGTI